MSPDAAPLPDQPPHDRAAAQRDRVHQVGLAEMLSALSHALDMTEGQPPGHTLRACLIGLRIADEIGLDADAREALYYALLLKDAGCSSNAARMAVLFGSPDQQVKYRMKLVDWQSRGTARAPDLSQRRQWRLAAGSCRAVLPHRADEGHDARSHRDPL